jgi:glutathione S-transferase
MATIQIYGVPPSPFTRATRLAAREKGVDYELVPTRPGETAPINPLGKIPARARHHSGTEEGIRVALKRSERVVGIFDKHLADHRFLAGEQVTAADLFLVPIFFYFPEIPELKALAEASPNCGRWARDMGARPSVKATDPQFRGLNR